MEVFVRLIRCRLWVFWLAGLLLCAPWCGAVPIEVMTFNIRGDFDGGVPTPRPTSWLATEGVHRRDLVIDVIQAADPDILGVQEAFANQVDDLSDALPGYGFYGVGRNDGNQQGEHSGIFYRAERFTPTDRGTFWLSQTPDVPGSVFPGAATVRIASWVTLEDRVTGRSIYTLNTHWDHVSQAARDHGAGLIRGELDTLPADVALLVMGDLNVNEDNTAFATLVEAGDGEGSRALRDSYRQANPIRDIREGTFNAFRGASFGARIDHILHSDDFETLGSAIVRTEFDGRSPSDHYPVTSTLRLVPEPGGLAFFGGLAAFFGLRRR